LQLQKNEGIDAVIVDSVLKVRKGLQGPNQEASTDSVHGASLVVPPNPFHPINEASEALNGLNLNEHARSQSEVAQAS
jgi:glycerophosphodiester phosphodiesterase